MADCREGRPEVASVKWPRALSQRLKILGLIIARVDRIQLDAQTRVLVLTGAGVSAESGVPTFRDAHGLWEQHRFEDVASPEGFAADPATVWRFYSQRRAGAGAVQPNPGHHALVALEQALGDRFLLATQNVDDLHRRAGSHRLVELHGNLFVSRCADCPRPAFADASVHAAGEVPRCELCGGRLRPHIVWFGESLNPEDLERVWAFLGQRRGGRLVFLAVGTSGAVYPAAGLVDLAREAGAETWLVNADPADNHSRFEHVVRGRSGEVLPHLFAG